MRDLININIKKGFTLVEMLVVISVIGILASLALTSYNVSQRQARDTQRKSDLKQYQTALENFANNNNSFYLSRTSVQRLSDKSILCTPLGITGECPIDPKYDSANEDVHDYYYVSNGTGIIDDATEYLMFTVLEGSGNYWIVCSNGKSGNSEIRPTDYNCSL